MLLMVNALYASTAFKMANWWPSCLSDARKRLENAGSVRQRVVVAQLRRIARLAAATRLWPSWARDRPPKHLAASGGVRKSCRILAGSFGILLTVSALYASTAPWRTAVGVRTVGHVAVLAFSWGFCVFDGHVGGHLGITLGHFSSNVVAVRCGSAKP